MEKLIFLDTETTGNEAKKDRLCQICYETNGGVKSCFFKPPLPVGIKAMSITHITNKMLEDKEAFHGSETEKELQKLLDEGILVAHNAKFDVMMLEAEGMKVPKKICTLRVARYLDKENLIPEYNLQFLRYFLDLNVDGFAHNAEDDVRVLKALFGRLLKKMVEETGSEETAVKRMMEVSETPTLYTKINFGKYKDKALDEIAKTDPRYLEWLLKSKLENEEMEEDWIYTLKHYLSLK